MSNVRSYALGVAAASLLVAASLGAQQPTPSQPTQTPAALRPTLPPLPSNATRADTVRRMRDSLARVDSAARNKSLVTWVSDSDSVAVELTKRPGMRVTRYQGDKVTFDATQKALTIVGKPGAVGRDQTVVIGDTVLYDDSTKLVTAIGDTVILHDPSQQSADVVARGRVAYNTALGRGIASNISTSVESGERYYLSGQQTAFVRDTSGGRRSAYYVRNGIITSCDDSVPDYYFKSGEIKYVSKSLIVARPATLYVAGVPVFWLPFLFQDIRNGRRSGLLTPRFGLSEFVRNSSSYRRHVENLGYYANLGDYMDAQMWFDWRSSARGTVADPGFSTVNGEFRYRWLDRFITGSVAGRRDDRRDGSKNTSVSWTHSQQFSATSAFNADINFSTNTQLQRDIATNPYSVNAQIRSDARYNRKVGPFSVDLGGSRNQYSGRSQVDESYPSVSVTSPTLALTRWLDWTPNFVFNRRATLKSDQAGSVFYRYFTNAAGQPDSSRISSSTYDYSTALQTPVTIFGFLLGASGTYTSHAQNYPTTRTFVDPTDTTKRITRTYARSVTNQADWDLPFTLPTFLQSSLKISPQVRFANVYSGPYWVQSELSNGQWVHQSKRPVTGLSMSPTVYALFPGFGPLTRIRHSVTLGVSYGYAPAAAVPDQYLRALNITQSGFLGSLAQNSVTLNLSQTIEGKFRSDTGASDEGKKVKLLSMNFDALTYNFERARVTHRSGLETSTFGYSATSDLLPGLQFRSSYSLYQGDVQSDTARLSPYLTDITTSFTINGQSGIFSALNRLFGRPTQKSAGQVSPLGGSAEDAQLARLSSLPVAGSYSRDRQYQIPETETWTSTINFTLNRQRPPVGGRVVTYDPASVCASVANIPTAFQTCQLQQQLNPTTINQTTDPIAGGIFVRIPPREMINGNTTLHLTEKWSTNWGTAYDVTHRQFASNQITLQRDLHDWRAVFSFTESPNGNSYFSFFIANKAQPDLKFNYDKPTYRQQDLR